MLTSQPASNSSKETDACHFLVERDNAFLSAVRRYISVSQLPMRAILENHTLSRVPESGSHREKLHEFTQSLTRLSGGANIRNIRQLRFLKHSRDDFGPLSNGHYPVIQRCPLPRKLSLLDSNNHTRSPCLFFSENSDTSPIRNFTSALNYLHHDTPATVNVCSPEPIQHPYRKNTVLCRRIEWSRLRDSAHGAAHRLRMRATGVEYDDDRVLLRIRGVDTKYLAETSSTFQILDGNSETFRRRHIPFESQSRSQVSAPFVCYPVRKQFTQRPHWKRLRKTLELSQ